MTLYQVDASKLLLNLIFSPALSNGTSRIYSIHLNYVSDYNLYRPVIKLRQCQYTKLIHFVKYGTIVIRLFTTVIQAGRYFLLLCIFYTQFNALSVQGILYVDFQC